ncbi:MAG: hypothetical protein AAF191_21530, partial [Verrucomicrobiota bacterium]
LWWMGYWIAGPLPPFRGKKKTLVGESPSSLDLEPGETVVWRGATTPMHPWTIVLILVCVVIPFVITLVTAPDRSTIILITSIIVPTLVLCVAFSHYTISLGRTGLRVRTCVGIPCLHLPLKEIKEVRAGEANGFQHGGWGFRMNGEGIAILTRSGPAMVILRQDGRILRITLEDSEEAVTVLNTLIQRESA